MINKYNNKWTLQNIKQHIKLFKNNEIYRLGDGIKFKKNHKLVKYILNNNKYDNSILKLYHQENNMDLNQIIKQKIEHYDIKSDDKTLYVHIRQGDDYNGRCLGNIKNFKFFLENINSSFCEKVIIVTAFHYGTSDKSSLYSSNKHNYSDINYIKNINRLYQLISNINKPIDIISSEDVDLDFIHLVTCKNLLTSEHSGSFSKLVKKYNIHLNNNTKA